MLIDTLEKVITVPPEDNAKSFLAPAVVPDEIKAVNIAAMKPMYTKNCNPYLLFKAQPGLMKHSLMAWMGKPRNHTRR